MRLEDWVERQIEEEESAARTRAYRRAASRDFAITVALNAAIAFGMVLLGWLIYMAATASDRDAAARRRGEAEAEAEFTSAGGTRAWVDAQVARWEAK